MSFLMLINASNLHNGGGVQVAVSFISEISTFKDDVSNIDLIVSSLVYKNLVASNVSLEFFRSYSVVDNYGIKSIYYFKKNLINKYAVVFTVFGPLYSLFKPKFSIVGFAQPWIIYPKNEVYAKMHIYSRFKTKLKFLIQRMFFLKSEILVVELEDVGLKLEGLFGFERNKIKVVKNAVASFYLHYEENTELVPAKSNLDLVKLGYVGRNYLHKNTSVFPQIAKILRDKYRVNVKFYVTFTEEEWSECTEDFRACSVNVGVLNVMQCPSFYKSVDAIVFPSLLECFSATPLEAMIMGKPIFVSDRKFLRDICGCHAYYFDPCNPESAADTINSFFRGPISLQSLKLAKSYALNYSSARDRALAYLKIMQSFNI